MIKSYKKVLEMESVASLKLEQDRKALEKIQKETLIFKNTIEGKDYLSFNVEELIDSRMFDNKDEIIIMDLNFDEKLLNLGYLCDSLDYTYLSYSEDIKNKLSDFVNYVINKNIYK